MIFSLAKEAREVKEEKEERPLYPRRLLNQDPPKQDFR